MTEIYDNTGLLMSGATANGAGDAHQVPSNRPYRSFQADIAGSGAVSATVTIEGSIDGVTWVLALASMSLTGTGSDVKGAEDVSAYPQLRARVASISGTNAAVTVRVALSQ